MKLLSPSCQGVVVAFPNSNEHFFVFTFYDLPASFNTVGCFLILKLFLHGGDGANAGWLALQTLVQGFLYWEWAWSLWLVKSSSSLKCFNSTILVKKTLNWLLMHLRLRFCLARHTGRAGFCHVVVCMAPKVSRVPKYHPLCCSPKWNSYHAFAPLCVFSSQKSIHFSETPTISTLLHSGCACFRARVWFWILGHSNTIAHRATGSSWFISSTFTWAHLLHVNFVPAGVITYAIGVAWAAQDELEVIATHPAKDHAFFVDEFDNLYRSVPKVIQNICTEFNSQPRNWIKSRQKSTSKCCFPDWLWDNTQCIRGSRARRTWETKCCYSLPVWLILQNLELERCS